MHFWLKRHEICGQIEGWITELAKLQLAERVDRSMVLRRQYRQLREELAKLPIPAGLEDLDQPFSAAVQGSPSAAGGGAGAVTATAASVTELPAASPSVVTSSASASDNNDFINITQLSSTDANMNDVENHHGLG